MPDTLKCLAHVPEQLMGLGEASNGKPPKNRGRGNKEKIEFNVGGGGEQWVWENDEGTSRGRRKRQGQSGCSCTFMFDGRDLSDNKARESSSCIP